ncbi:MAG: hypothetical protein ACEQSB_04995 [Undibacterium sp.]
MDKRLFIILGVVALLAGGVLWCSTTIKRQKDPAVTPVVNQQEQEETFEPIKVEYSVRPDFSKVQAFKNTLKLQKGVSVKYGSGWVGKKTGDDEFVNGQLIKKTASGRSYLIGFQENGIEFFSPDLQKNSLKSSAYQEVQINGKPHFILVVSNVSSGDGRYDFTYLVSPCPNMEDKACSVPLKGGLLYVSLEQYVPNAQEAKPLDFSRKDDQQILAEFAEIMSTLQY